MFDIAKNRNTCIQDTVHIFRLLVEYEIYESLSGNVLSIAANQSKLHCVYRVYIEIA